MSLKSCFQSQAHPMAIMIAVVGGLSSVFCELDGTNPEHRWLACMRIVAKMPVLAAMAYKTSIGQPIMYAKERDVFAHQKRNIC